MYIYIYSFSTKASSSFGSYSKIFLQIILNILISPLASQMPMNYRWKTWKTRVKFVIRGCSWHLPPPTQHRFLTSFKNEQRRQTPNGWKPSQSLAQRHLRRKFLRSRLHQGATPDGTGANLLGDRRSWLPQPLIFPKIIHGLQGFYKVPQLPTAEKLFFSHHQKTHGA